MNEPVPSDAQAIIDHLVKTTPATQRLANVNDCPVAIDSQGNVKPILEVVERAKEAMASAPLRRRGTAQFRELAGFLAHVNRFKNEASVIFADIEHVKLTAILNYHPAGAASGPAWGDHRSHYVCPLSNEWRTWTESNSKPMDQATFAQFIEDNLDDIVIPVESASEFPTSATVLEVARDLQVKSGLDFRQAINLATGETQMIYDEKHASGGGKGQVTVPRAFLIGIPVFMNGIRYQIEARLRYRIKEGALIWFYRLHRHDRARDDAFADIRNQAEQETSLPVWAGQAETP